MTSRPAGPLYLAEMWHRLSLDAPTVALVWSIFLARSANVRLPYYSPVLLALGTWIVYVADRILDGLREPPTRTLHARHHFYARHRLFFVITLGCAVLLCAGLIVTRMRRDIFDGYTVLGSLVLFYFFLIHGVKSAGELWLPKELLVGILFAMATALPSWMRTSAKSQELLIGVGLFAAICWLNCVAIEFWESAEGIQSQAQEKFARANISTRWLGKHLAWMSAALAVLSLAFWMTWRSPVRPVALACFLSALFFLILHWYRVDIGPRWLRVAADISLLTPILLLPWIPRL